MRNATCPRPVIIDQSPFHTALLAAMNDVLCRADMIQQIFVRSLMSLAACSSQFSQEVSVDRAFMQRRRLSHSLAAMSGRQWFSINSIMKAVPRRAGVYVVKSHQREAVRHLKAV